MIYAVVCVWTDWEIADFQSLLESLLEVAGDTDVLYNKIPTTWWNKVAEMEDNSPETCEAAWNRLCKLVRPNLFTARK
jgi:hypothetical protein